MSLTSRRTVMARKRYKPEEIVAKLRQVDVLVSQGQNMVDAAGSPGLHTFIRMFPGGKAPEYPTELAHERPEPCCYREQRNSGAGRSTGSNRLVLFPALRR